MTPDFKREFVQHSAFALCFLFGLITADKIMGDRAPDLHSVAAGQRPHGEHSILAEIGQKNIEHPAVPRTTGLESGMVPITSRGTPLEDKSKRVTVAKPVVHPVSFVRGPNRFLSANHGFWSLAESGANTTESTNRASASAVNEPKPDDGLADSLELVRKIENARIETIKKVSPAVVCIFGLERQGGGSGVLIHPSGLALTNHHVVAACGIEGWGGLSDGKLYRWRLIGNDPGGDLALIQLEGMDEFPFVQMGDSDQVKVGDWTLVMGNPFTLADDYTPTVTHGIVSGVHRYQPGMADVMLVYGDCIQTDTSINPGNSGGPLFDMQGKLIGINGRASFDFKSRGRVNVGLGYAISVNQCRNFLPELMATKLVQHGTLDAVFQDRNGKVTCIAMYEDSEVGQLGMALGDELLEFESRPIHSANQFTNLICTLPAGWPARLKMRREDGSEYEISARLLGLPYPKTAKAAVEPTPPKQQPDNEENPDGEAPMEENPESDPESILGRQDKLRQQIERSKKQLNQFLAGQPGVAQFPDIQEKMTQLFLNRWRQNRNSNNQDMSDKLEPGKVWQVQETITLTDGSQLELVLQFNPAADLWGMRTGTSTPNAAESDDQMAGWEVNFRRADGQWFTARGDEDQNDQRDSDTEKNERLSRWRKIDEAELMESTLGSQLVWIRQHLRNEEILPLGEWTLAGSGKADHQIAIRLKHQSDNRQQSIWLRLDDWTQGSNVQLLRAAEDEDGRYSLGATLYDQWGQVEAGTWPVKRRVVFGLLQEERARIVTQSCQQVPRDPAILGEQ